MESKMFCFQCQETAGCSGCTKFGVCGKSPDLARMQDLLIYTTKGLSEITSRLRKEGKEDSTFEKFMSQVKELGDKEEKKYSDVAWYLYWISLNRIDAFCATC